MDHSPSTRALRGLHCKAAGHLSLCPVSEVQNAALDALFVGAAPPVRPRADADAARLVHDFEVAPHVHPGPRPPYIDDVQELGVVPDLIAHHVDAGVVEADQVGHADRVRALSVLYPVGQDQPVVADPQPNPARRVKIPASSNIPARGGGI